MNTHYIRLKLNLSRIECSALKGRPETLISSTFARLIPNLRIPNLIQEVESVHVFLRWVDVLFHPQRTRCPFLSYCR